jgi:stage V sporulation protein SpoVS
VQEEFLHFAYNHMLFHICAHPLYVTSSIRAIERDIRELLVGQIRVLAFGFGFLHEEGRDLLAKSARSRVNHDDDDLTGHNFITAAAASSKKRSTA